MTKLILWASVVAGFGWTSYFAVPLVLVGAWRLLAQGQMPEWSGKDFANVGGFAVFALAMYRLHSVTVAQFRDDLKAERDLREKHGEAIQKHAEAMQAMTTANNRLAETISRGNPPR